MVEALHDPTISEYEPHLFKSVRDSRARRIYAINSTPTLPAQAPAPAKAHAADWGGTGFREPPGIEVKRMSVRIDTNERSLLRQGPPPPLSQGQGLAERNRTCVCAAAVESWQAVGLAHVTRK